MALASQRCGEKDDRMSVPLTAVVVESGEGEVLLGISGTRYSVRITSADTGGEFSVVEVVLPPGAVGAAPHSHREHSEHFQVGAGEITFIVGDDERVVAGDGWVTIPRGVRHGFRNDGEVDALYRCAFTPAGYEDYFRQIDAAVRAGREPDGDELARLRSRYGTDPA